MSPVIDDRSEIERLRDLASALEGDLLRASRRMGQLNAELARLERQPAYSEIQLADVTVLRAVAARISDRIRAAMPDVPELGETAR